MILIFFFCNESSLFLMPASVLWFNNTGKSVYTFEVLAIMSVQCFGCEDLYKFVRRDQLYWRHLCADVVIVCYKSSAASSNERSKSCSKNTNSSAWSSSKWIGLITSTSRTAKIKFNSSMRIWKRCVLQLNPLIPSIGKRVKEVKK